MSKGTIIYVGWFELPDKNAAAHRVLSNGKILKSLGYKVVFIDIDKSILFNKDILTTNKNVQGFDCWSIPYPKKINEWMKNLSSIDYLDIMKNLYIDVEGIIAYNYPALALYNLKKYGTRNRIKIIADCTEWYSTKGSNLIFKIIKGLDSFFRMRVIQKHLDGLIVISKFLENYYGNCKNVLRLPPLVDINEKKWNIKFAKKEEGSKVNNKLRIVYSGSPGKNKDKVNYIIDALYKLKNLENYEMDIVGLSKEQFLRYYPNFKNKINVLDDRINFLGKVSHEDSLRMLNQADYSIFIREKSRLTMAGFPTKFVESITSSTPVITNNTSDISEYFIDNQYGYLLKDSKAENIKEVLEKIINLNIEERRIHSMINSKIFHYSSYCEAMQKMLCNVMQYNTNKDSGDEKSV